MPSVDPNIGGNGRPSESSFPSSNETGLNLGYFKTAPGVVNIAQLVLGIVLFILSTPIWLSIVKYLAFIISFLWTWIHLFRLQKRFQFSVPWPVLEFCYNAGATVAYGVAALVTFITIAWMTAAIFAIINTVVYATGAFFLLGEWRTHNQKAFDEI